LCGIRLAIDRAFQSLKSLCNRLFPFRPYQCIVACVALCNIEQFIILLLFGIIIIIVIFITQLFDLVLDRRVLHFTSDAEVKKLGAVLL